MMKTFSGKCTKICQLKNWSKKKPSIECPDQSRSANEGENVPCPREIFHTAIICLTDNKYSNFLLNDCLE